METTQDIVRKKLNPHENLSVKSPQESFMQRGAFRSFEDVYRTSYSHGLEAIYNIETVDLKTVRRIDPPSKPKEIKQVEKEASELAQPLEPQLEFDFGDSFRESMDSFVLKEPIQVLGLSKYAERSLNENGMHNLRQLLNADLSTFVYLKGMGQGHIDEIQQRLNEYIHGKILYQTPVIDFYAWMRSLMPGISLKKLYVLLEPFNMAQLCVLTPSEQVEVRRLTAEMRCEWRQESILQLHGKKQCVYDEIKKVMEVYVIPWIKRRQGFASQQEIFERLGRVAVISLSGQDVFSFFSEVFFESEFPFKFFLMEEGEYYFVDDATLIAYNTVVKKAKTYFYKINVRYTVSELIKFLEREFALSWENFDEGFIEKCLRASDSFRVYKAEGGRLMVRLK